MHGFIWFGGLLLVLIGLFLLATFKTKKQTTANFTPQNPKNPPNELQILCQSLTPLLPKFELITKTGVQNRILIYQQQKHLATVVLIDSKPNGTDTAFNTRKLGEVLILQIYSGYHLTTLKEVAHTIHQHK